MLERRHIILVKILRMCFNHGSIFLVFIYSLKEMLSKLLILFIIINYKLIIIGCNTTASIPWLNAFGTTFLSKLNDSMLLKHCLIYIITLRFYITKIFVKTLYLFKERIMNIIHSLLIMSIKINNFITILLLLTLLSLFCYNCNGLSSNREKVSKEPLNDSIKLEIKIKFIDTVLLPDTVRYRR